jgi:hypothetical protein
VVGGVGSGEGGAPFFEAAVFEAAVFEDCGFEDCGDRDDGLLLVGSFSVNDLNMRCPIVTR